MSFFLPLDYQNVKVLSRRTAVLLSAFEISKFLSPEQTEGLRSFFLPLKNQNIKVLSRQKDWCPSFCLLSIRKLNPWGPFFCLLSINDPKAERRTSVLLSALDLNILIFQRQKEGHQSFCLLSTFIMWNYMLRAFTFSFSIKKFSILQL